MTDDLVRGWAPVYPHIHYGEPGEAIAWLTRVFGFRELVRMAEPDGTVITSKLEGPGGGLVMVAGSSPDRNEWIAERVPDFREQRERPWPNLSHATTVIVGDVDAHHERARTEGATILTLPTDQPWGLRSYAAIDLEGHRWEFSQTLGLVEPEAWGATRIDERVGLEVPRIPASAGALIFDQVGRLLILKPNYKKGWTVPGGQVDSDGESPWEACRRETREECDLQVEHGRLLCVDFLRPKPNRPGGLRFLFHCGVLTDRELSAIRLQDAEIDAHRFVALGEAMALLSGPLRRRVSASAGTERCVYLQDGRTVATVEA